MRQLKLKKIVVAAALALSALALTAPVGAAGLGKLTVTSALGQPLRAEIDLTAVSREEATSISSRLASPDAFRQAGIDYNPALLGVRFSVARRPSGQFFISLTSNQPINEPFIDLLVELNWATGRLVREYTFLLDPADMRPLVPPVASAEPKPVAQVEAPRAVEPPRAPVAAVPPAPMAKPAPVAKPAPAPKPERTPNVAGSYEVKRGDSLGKIARQAKPEGVSLEQMLMAIQRNNPDAFVGGNINRLKSGVILNLPGKDEAATLAQPDARRMVAAQASDWRSYQNKLAAGVQAAPAAKAEAPRQAAQGRITAKVEDKSQKGDAKDQLKLSKADPAAAKDGAKGKPKAAEEDKIAKERALKDAKSREAELEKNVKDLQKLAEVKNQQLADMQKQAQGKAGATAAPQVAQGPVADARKAPEPAKAAPAPAPAVSTPPPAASPAAPVAKAEPPKAMEPPKAVEAPKAPEPPKAAEQAKAAEPVKGPDAAKADAAKAPDSAKPAEPAKAPEPVATSEPPKSAEPPKGADAAKPADAPKVADAAKAPPKKPAAPPPPPPPEPSLMDEFLDNPAYLAAGGGVLALLGGYAAYAVRRKRKVEKFENSIITGGDLKANSVFGNTGGQNVDTGNSSFQSDFSQVSSGSIDADEVDPVAEADVYMAYGRDAQAEEILKEALLKDAGRHAVRAKLMEIYSQRADTASFESHAKELHAATGGQGEHWARAAELGRALMPGNPLFGASDGTSSPAADPMVSTVTLGAGALAATAAATAAAATNMESTMQMAAFPATEKPVADPMTKTLAMEPVQSTASNEIDFDFDGATTQPLAGTAPDFDFDAAPSSPDSDGGMSLDFDIGGPEPATVKVAPAVVPATDFAPGGTLIMQSSDVVPDHSMDETQPLADMRLPEPPSPTIDFDFDLGGDAPATAGAAATEAAGNVMDFDLSGINLDLPSGDAAGSGAADAPMDDAATKLDLAKAYQDMGDKEGARELLQEVLKEGSETQKAEAKNLLAAIG